MIETQLVFRNEYRLDLKQVPSILLPYVFASSDTNLIISIEANPTRNYNSAGRIERVLIDYPGRVISGSYILGFSSQEIELPSRGRFKLEFFPNVYIGRTRISIHKMFYSSTSKQQTTQAQSTADISVTSSAKSIILSEKTGSDRHSYLISNTGSSTVYFKYVPIGTDPNTVTVSSSSYDFSLAANEKFSDDNSSQNAIIGICSGLLATAKVKVTEYLYL